jgi:outer membrane receptor protein involved in Fe transport
MKSRLTVAGAVALALAASQAHADSAPGVQSLEDITVTATKREEKLKDVAMGISAVSGEDLVRRNESGFVDFAAQVPGLSLQVTNPGQIRLVLRGANVGSVGATVATVVDDVPFSMTGAQSDGAYFGANVDTYDLQRIEVLRGPQGTLYGATAEGGLIRYVTNLPDLTRVSGEFGVGGETVSDGGSRAKVRGMINLPLIDGKLAFRASAVKDDSPGWIDNTQLGVKDWNKIDKWSFRASLLWKPTERLTARFTYFRQSQHNFGNNNVQVVGAALTPASPPANQFDLVAGQTWRGGVPLDSRNELRAYALNVQYDFDAFSLMSSTSYGENDLPFRLDLSNSNVAAGVSYSDLFGGLVYGVPLYVVIHQTDFVHKLNQELRVTSKPGTKIGGLGLDWQGGVFYTHEVTTLDQPLDALDASTGAVLAPPIGAANIPSGLKEKSAFADFTLHFTDQFDVEVGGRHSKTDQFSQVKLFCCIAFGPDNVFPREESSESKTTYSIAPRFKFADGTMVYARYATGYRAGGPNLPTPQLPNPPMLQPDSTKNYEVGIRTDFLDRRLSVDLTAFEIQWRDVQILGIVNTPTGPIGINGNSGKARSRGLEWNLQFKPIPTLQFGLVGAYTDAKIESDAPGLGAFKNDKLPYVPDVQTTLNADWTVGTFSGFSATAGASYSYFGPQYTDFSPSTDVIESHVKLPKYQTLKLQLGIDNGHFNAQLYANNLTNKHAIVSFANNGGFGQTGLGVAIQPRTIGVMAGYKF